jgi:hypothetical protein
MHELIVLCISKSCSFAFRTNTVSSTERSRTTWTCTAARTKSTSTRCPSTPRSSPGSPSVTPCSLKKTWRETTKSTRKRFIFPRRPAEIAVRSRTERTLIPFICPATCIIHPSRINVYYYSRVGNLQTLPGLLRQGDDDITALPSSYQFKLK